MRTQWAVITPILLRFGETMLSKEQKRHFDYIKASLEQFSDKDHDSVNGNRSTDESNNSICAMVLHNAYECIPIKQNPNRKISVPWWNSNAV